MGFTKIRGTTQILEKSITSAQLADDAGIALGQLTDGAELFKRDGSVAMTGDFNANGHKITGLAAVTDANADSDAASVAYVKAKISSIVGPLEYKGIFDASAGTFPAANLGDFYKVTVAGTIDGLELAVGDMIIANKAGASKAADFDKIDNTDAVTSVAGRVGAVVLKLADLTDVTATADEVNYLSGAKSNIQAQLDKISGDTASQLQAETTRATAAEEALNTALSTEITRAKAAEATLQTGLDTLNGPATQDGSVSKAVKTAVDAEAADRKAAEGDLATLKTTAKDTLVNAINEVSDAVAKEATDRIAAITKEVADRDTAIAAAITKEVADRDAAIAVVSATIKFVDEEIPAGAIDGTNTIFTIANEAIDGTVKLFVNGLRLRAGAANDFTVVGKTITMNFVPLVGDVLLVDYRSK